MSSGIPDLEANPPAVEVSEPVVLASRSPRRKWILERMGVDFKIVPPTGVAELAPGGWLSPRQVPLENAFLKARRVADLVSPGRIVLGADTVVLIDSSLLGKPRNWQEAVEMLMALSGRWHEVITGVCLVRSKDNLLVSFADVSRVLFKSFDKTFAANYAERVGALDKAGAYAIQDGGDEIIERVDGSIFNVMGLPAERLAETFRAIQS